MITAKISLGQAGIFSCSLLLSVDTRDKHRGDAVSTMHWDFKPVGDCSTQSKEKLPTTLLFQTDFHIAHYWMHTAASHVLSLGLSNLTVLYTGSAQRYCQNYIWVNWTYNQHKEKRLATTFKLL